MPVSAMSADFFGLAAIIQAVSNNAELARLPTTPHALSASGSKPEIHTHPRKNLHGMAERDTVT
jgi:hypothetical protein